jgi:hypothetical protein
MRFDGTEWTALTGGAPPGFGVGSRPPTRITNENLRSVAAREGALLAVGEGGAILSYDGETFTVQNAGEIDLLAVVPFGADGWVVLDREGIALCRAHPPTYEARQSFSAP